MAQFSDLVNGVYNTTKRKDLVNETQQALIRAIIKEHAAFDYPDDLVLSGSIALTPTTTPDNYRYSVPISSVVNPYYTMRKIKLVSELLSSEPSSLYSNSSYWGDLQFEERAVDNIFDNYNLEYQCYYTRIGQTLNIVAPRTVANIAIGYYSTPNLSVPANYGVAFTDWLADEYPYVLWDAAAAEIFRIIGKDSEQKVFMQKIMDNRLDIIKAKIGAI